jgi:signal transduction histidine kinase/ligand-binding sensor domain-containing protein/DNA-binding NarL/FixJ family response regulator
MVTFNKFEKVINPRFYKMQVSLRFRNFILFLFIQSFLFLPGLTADISGLANFDVFTEREGLPNNTITCLYQDSRGFIWIGTYNGLARYDGYHFKIFKYDRLDNFSLSNNRINNIFEDSKGYLWICTANGLNRFDFISEKFRTFRNIPGDTNSLKDNRIWGIGEDFSGNIWVGTQGMGRTIYRLAFKGDSVKYSSWENGFINIWIKNIVRDKQGNMWFFSSASDDGICVLDAKDVNKSEPVSKRITHIPGDQGSLAGNSVNAVFHKDKSGIWIGTETGLSTYISDENKFFSYYSDQNNSSTLLSDNISAITSDQNGFLWIGHDEGISRLLPSTGEISRIPASVLDPANISRNRILSMLVDKSNVLWIGSFNGLLKLNQDNKNFNLLRYDSRNRSSLSSNIIRPIIVTTEGLVWIGTEGGGLNILDRNSQSIIRPVRRNDIAGEIPDNIISLNQRDPGEVWITSGEEGVFRLTYNHHYKGAAEIKKLNINCEKIVSTKLPFVSHEDRSGEIFIGSWGSEAFIRFVRNDEIEKSIKNARISSLGRVEKIPPWMNDYSLVYYDHMIDKVVLTLFEDHSGIIWIGTLLDGLIRFNKANETFVFYKNNRADTLSICNNNIYSIYENKDGLWIGTSDGLALRPRGAEYFINYSRDILPCSSIWGIVEDSYGRLWLSTDKGIVRFSPHSGEAKLYDQTDELNTVQFELHGYARGQDGEVFFGGNNGIVRFFPDSIYNSKFSPDVYITGLEIFNKPLAIGQKVNNRIILKKSILETRELTLSYRENIFTFEFASLDFTNPAKNIYQYRMQGFDQSWIQTDANRRFATYTNLDPGKYTFMVMGSNSDGIWNKTPVGIAITILPPYWKTWWFKGLLFVFLILTTLLWLKLRTRNLKNQKRKLQREVLIRTGELEESNRQLQNQKIEILEQKEKVHEMANKLHEIDQMKLDFFTNISHEFRTPLTLVINPAEKLLKTRPKETELLLIQQNALRLKRLIDQILDIQKMDINKLEINLSQIDLTLFCRKLIQAFSIYAERQQVSLRLVHPQQQIEVWTDAEKLEKILFNLISNAIKFSYQKGTVTISLLITASSPGQWFEIKVADEGMGIPRNQIDRIFERFYQGESTKIFNKGGTGIGLFYTKSLVELLKGTIEVQSENFKGSVFAVKMPGSRDLYPETPVLEHLSPVNSAMDELIGSMGGGITERDERNEGNEDNRKKQGELILLVEDNADIRSFVKNELGIFFEVIEAENGKEGLEMALELAPDLVIADIMMPVMDGNTLCRNIKSDERISHIPVIMLTARASDENRKQGFELGADEYIVKPFSIDVLIARIINMLETRQKLRKKFSREINLDPSEITVTPADEIFLKKLIEITEKNISDIRFTGENLAKEAGVSLSLLYKKLRALTDQSANEFIRIIRLKRAAQYISKGRENYNEIAIDVGFNNYSYFSKSFRNFFGIPPSEYKNTPGKKNNHTD